MTTLIYQWIIKARSYQISKAQVNFILKLQVGSIFLSSLRRIMPCLLRLVYFIFLSIERPLLLSRLSPRPNYLPLLLAFFSGCFYESRFELHSLGSLMAHSLTLRDEHSL